MRPGPVSRVKETLCSAAGESRSRAYLTGRRLPAHRPPVLRVAVFFFFFFSLSLSAQDGGDLLSISGHHGRKGSSSPVLLQPPSLFHFFFLPLRVSFGRQQNWNDFGRPADEKWPAKKNQNFKVSKTKSRDQPDDHYRPTSGPTFKLRQIFVSGPRISEWFQRTERNVTWWKWTKWAIRFFRSSFVFSGRTRR